MKIFYYLKLKFDILFYSKKSFHLFLMILFLFLIIYEFPKSKNDKILINSSNDYLNLKKTLKYNNIPMSCIEPHCSIQCSILYQSNDTDGIIRMNSLDNISQEHLMIDLGEDLIVNQLINSIPSPKLCPYRKSSFLFFKKTSNLTIKFYPILFGFIDKYFLKTISKKVLINNQIKEIEQICLPKKSIDFSSLIPGQRKTYQFGFENELEYRRLYSQAYFAITKKKSGWDCNRHYEILSSGTIPFFDNLNQTGNNTLSLLPKILLNQAQNLPGINRKHLNINHNLFNLNEYYLLLHRLLYYSKHRLTTVKMAEYILNIIQYSLNSTEKHSVLFISHEKSDYMKDYMLHGFTNIFKQNLHVYQPPKFMYKYSSSLMWNEKETNKYYGQNLYGFGYGYKLTLQNYIHLYERDIQQLSNRFILQNNIQQKKYSLIIFGSIIRNNQLFQFTTQYYQQSRIILIDGEDQEKNSHRAEYAKLGTYFLREISDHCHQIF